LNMNHRERKHIQVETISGSYEWDTVSDTAIYDGPFYVP